MDAFLWRVSRNIVCCTGELSLNERTRFQRCLVTCLLNCIKPAASLNEIENMTVYTVVEALFMAKSAGGFERIPIRLVQCDKTESTETEHYLAPVHVKSLEIYWKDVRPNFLPEKPVDKKKLQIRIGEMTMGFHESEYFFVSRDGNEHFRVRQIPWFFTKETSKLIETEEARRTDQLQRKLNRMLPINHDPCYEPPACSALRKAIFAVINPDESDIPQVKFYGFIERYFI